MISSRSQNARSQRQWRMRLQDGVTGSAAAHRVEALWRRARGGERRPLRGADRTLDRIALNTLGVSSEELREVLPRFDAFDDLLAWSDARAGGLDRGAIDRFERRMRSRRAHADRRSARAVPAGVNSRGCRRRRAETTASAAPRPCLLR